MNELMGEEWLREWIDDFKMKDWEFWLFHSRRSPISVAAAAIYLASQASEGKKSQKGVFCKYVM